MKTTILTLVGLLGGALVDAQWTVVSKPFQLILQSTNATLDGTCKYACSIFTRLTNIPSALSTCHVGAARETLCTTSTRVPKGTTFQHNTSISDSSTSVNDSPGMLWQLLVAAGGIEYPSPMQIIQDGQTELAMLNFFPGQPFTAIRFAEDGAMYVSLNVNGKGDQKIESWYVCSTAREHEMETLNWKITMSGAPQNPTCQRVRVQRIYA
jgi:hypothetical protein